MTPTEIVNSDTDTFWKWFRRNSPQQPDETRRGKRGPIRPNQQSPGRDILLSLVHQAAKKRDGVPKSKPDKKAKQV